MYLSRRTSARRKEARRGPLRLRFAGNDQQYFDGCKLTVLGGWTELPLLQRAQYELTLRELLREDDSQVLKLAFGIDKAVNHDGVSIGIALGEMRPDDDVGLRCVRAADGTCGCRFDIPRQAILEDPALGQANVQVNGISEPVRPYS